MRDPRGEPKHQIRRTVSYCTVLAGLILSALPALSRSDPNSNHLQASAMLMSEGDFDGAEKEARLALREPSTRALAWATLGTIRLKQKKYDESADLLTTALRLNPRLLGARISLGDLY